MDTLLTPSTLLYQNHSTKVNPPWDPFWSSCIPQKSTPVLTPIWAYVRNSPPFFLRSTAPTTDPTSAPTDPTSAVDRWCRLDLPGRPAASAEDLRRAAVEDGDRRGPGLLRCRPSAWAEVDGVGPGGVEDGLGFLEVASGQWRVP